MFSPELYAYDDLRGEPDAEALATMAGRIEALLAQAQAMEWTRKGLVSGDRRHDASDDGIGQRIEFIVMEGAVGGLEEPRARELTRFA